MLIATGKDLLRAESGDNLLLSPKERSVWTGWMGILPEALLRNRRNSCPWHIRCTQIPVQARRQKACTWTRSCRAHALALKLSLSIVAWGHIFTGREKTGWAQEKPTRPKHSYHHLILPALYDRWKKPHMRASNYVCFLFRPLFKHNHFNPVKFWKENQSLSGTFCLSTSI